MTALATDSGRTAPARLASSAVLSVQSDERLVRLVRAGHERAFDAIVQRYRNQLVSFCRRILPDSRCEDAVQQAFINAHAALIASDEDLRLRPWLYAITRNAALNMLRQNGWNYDQIPLDFDGVRRPDQVFEQRIELQQTVAALHELPDRQRDALVMREFEGRSYEEIAVALGANDGAVRQLLNRARVTLRNAASLLVPPPLLARAAASVPPSDGRRVAEVFGGLGAAGVAKAGATALVAGSLVVGAVEAPLPIGGSHKATLAPAPLTVARHPTGRASRVALKAQPTTSGTRAKARTHHTSSPSSGASQRHEAESHARLERENSGRTQQRSGSDDGTRERSGSGGSGERSGSSESGSGSGTSGTSGSGTSGSDDRLSGTSGSGTSGSGTSGSADSVSSGSGTSTTSGSGTSGSGSSGSDSSGSGSGDVVTTTSPTTTTTTDSSGRSGSGSRSDSLEH